MRPSKVRAEPALVIGPGGLDGEAGFEQRFANSGDGVFVAVLGVNTLAPFERDFQANQLDIRRLVGGAFEVHLDTGAFRIP